MTGVASAHSGRSRLPSRENFTVRAGSWFAQDYGTRSVQVKEGQ